MGELIVLPSIYFFNALIICSYSSYKRASSVFNLSNFVIHSIIYLSLRCRFYCLFSDTLTLRIEIYSACFFIFYRVSKTSSSIRLNFTKLYKYTQNRKQMTSALQLEKKLQLLLDQVKDIFHATSLNIQALGVQMQHKNTPKELTTILNNCSSNLSQLQKLLDERSTLRLNYLITEQIKQEEAKVRRERLAEYQEKILDQRRLISDKESFYENLLRPKKKRPPHMTPEEFQDARRKEISEQQNRKFNMLKNEVVKMDEFYQLIKRQNDKLESALAAEENLEEQLNKRTDISEQIKNSQVLYQSLSQSLGSSEKSQALHEVFKSIQDIKIENESLMKEYMQQKQMQQYLQWQKKKLIEQYNSTKQELIKCREGHHKKVKPMFERPVSR